MYKRQVDESPVSAPLDYLHGHGSLISGLETALEGHEVGDKFDVCVNNLAAIYCLLPISVTPSAYLCAKPNAI